MNIDNLTKEQVSELAELYCEEQYGFEGLNTYPPCGKCIICLCKAKQVAIETENLREQELIEGLNQLIQDYQEKNNVGISTIVLDPSFRDVELSSTVCRITRTQ